jgi:hypothetical protein
MSGTSEKKSYQAPVNLVVIISCFLFCSSSCFAQDAEDKGEKVHKNTIRFNISNFVLFGNKNIIFGYERIVSPTQSFSINFGHAALPTLIPLNPDSIGIEKQTSKTGFNISADYRFYLAKENKHPIPRGVYIGPYVSFNRSRKNCTWNISHGNQSDLFDTETDFKILAAGFEVGYQFVFYNRLSVDLVVIGPGLARYEFNTKIGGAISDEDRDKLYETLQQALENRFPGMSVAIKDKEIEADGRLRVTSIGYRYLIHVGYRF